MASLNDKLIAAGGTIATIGASLLSVGLAENSGSHMTVWRNSWFEEGVAFLVIPPLLLVSMFVVWLIGRASQGPARSLLSVRRPIGLPEWRFTFQGGVNPLRIRLMDERWKLSGNSHWYFGLLVQIINSGDSAMTTEGVRLLDLSLKSKKNQHTWTTSNRKIYSTGNLDGSYLNALKTILGIGDGERLLNSGVSIGAHTIKYCWYAGEIDGTANGGRPGFILEIRDNFDDLHQLQIPVRPTRVKK